MPRETPDETHPLTVTILRTMIEMLDANPATVQMDEEGSRLAAVFNLPVESNDGPGSMPVLVEVETSPVLNLSQAAKYAQVTTRTLSRWRDTGLPSFDFVVGERRFPCFTLKSLERYMAQVGHKPGTLRTGEHGAVRQAKVRA